MIFGKATSSPEDRVVATYNIFLSPRSSGDMHVFQYPLRDKNRPYEGNTVQLSCTDGIHSTEEPKKEEVIHPGSRLRMSLTLDTFGSKSFSRTGNSSNAYSYNLQSKPFKPRSDYVVAYIDKNGLHFSPVSSIQQFTPLLSDNNKQASLDELEMEELSTKQFSEGQLDRSQREQLRQRSDMLGRDALTTKNIQVFQLGSPESLAFRARLAAPALEASRGHLQELPRDQIENCLFPPDLYGGKGDHSVPAIVRRFGSNYPLEQRVRELMLRCQILPLNIIVHSVSSDYEPASEREVLSILFKFCFWMHGVWVSRECPLFKGVCVSIRGVILVDFFTSPDATVSRAKLNALVRSSTNRKYIKDILESLAVLNNDPDPEKRRWKLRYTSDDAHTQAEYKKVASFFPNDIARQQSGLTQTCSKRDALVNALNAGKSVSLFAGGLDVQHSRETTNRIEPALSPQEQKIVDAISLNIRTILLRDGVLTKEALKTKLVEDRLSKYPNATANLLQLSMKAQVQTFTPSTLILKCIGEENIDRYRPIVISTALAMQKFTLIQIMEALKARLINEAIPEDIVKRVLSEIANFSLGDREYNLKNGLGNYH